MLFSECGCMLELAGLLLGRWRLATRAKGLPAAAGRTRDVLDLASGQRLGFVQSAPSTGWLDLRWLARRTLEVYETEDVSLLCSVVRPWGLAWTWHVLDAEERRVATVYRRLIRRGSGRPLALAEPQEPPAPGRFLDVQGRELATFALTPEGTALIFDPRMEDDPFARMALLGAVLSFEP
jgi:hypothetical protein